ncbi:peptidoglycan hydrolase-like protein with peptidoglycan-binding domain [Thermocatellispora tengchongensis]|uniref:Peptidoglycan hydrolase-like protein with peptidoglycan-binding domain n=1 Tax=Thermocatellispora tengchongensis TaxID=1073253 RepID=A0A840PD35_9ACTN|nr:peptidoglycan-binding protein [Thermocatellispora tengchongensis]MBB5136626.1 peptidoglycan hydrolase-like protein with peptidoglycan-binding domain [Thermocatellispora tengchongensis]
MTGSRRGGRPLVWAAAVLAGCGGVAAAVLVTGAGPEPEAPRPAPPGPARATVERTTLTERKTVRGTLGYAGRAEVTAAAPGRLTWRPRAGRVVRQGQRLYQVDGRDVLLLYGEQPAYRRLKAGDEGRDVRQFEKALAALGYTGFTVDDDYTAATAAAVRRWQEDRGLKETGEVDPATVWYAPGPVRVDARKAALGQTLAPGAPVLTLTSPRRVVTVPISIGDHRLVRVGGAVTVTLPGGKTVRGTVASIGSEVKKREGTGGVPEDTIDVTVDIPASRAALRFDRAPVEVSLVGSRRRDVLVVPVSALIALPGGGYGVTLLGPGGAARDIEVKTGMFADGKVEVSAPGLTAGAQVEVAR